MKPDLLRYLRRGDSPTDSAGQRRATRRTFLAAVGATGAGSVAAGRLFAGSDRRPPSENAGDSTSGGVVNATAPGEEQDAERPDPPADAPVIGANLNGRPHRLLGNLQMIDASDTSWVRAFVDVRKKLEAGRDPETDPDVVALRRAARERGCKLAVSLKWDFKANWGDKEPITVPPPGSRYERELLQCAVEYLESIGAPVDLVVLGNEPMWETLEEDIRVDDPPIVEFTRNAKEHLVRHGGHGDPTYLVGAFNRSHDPDVREEQFPQFFRGMFDLVHEDEDVDGVDLHLHFVEQTEAEAMVALAREELPDGTLTATEFSPVWRYHRHKDAPIAESEAGERFARDNGLPAGMTAVEYFEHAKRNPRPPEEVADFYAAMPWYNVNHVEDMYAMFADYGVDVGTFGFLQDLGMRGEDWTEGWLPFHINFLFQHALMRTEDGVEQAANLHYLEDYRRRAVAASGGST